MRASFGRRELKILISHAEYLGLRNRISRVLAPDKNAGEDGYFVRSMYFDDDKRTVYYEKEGGINDRKKYRIRAYNHSTDYIVLERKEKFNSTVNKNMAVIDLDTCNALINGDYDVLWERNEAVCKEFYITCKNMGLKASVIVDYHREAYVYPACNVRITFDKHLRACGITDMEMFGNPRNAVSIPVFMNDSVIFEVKYDDFLPKYIRGMIPSFIGVPTSLSKYCLCLDKKMAARY